MEGEEGDGGEVKLGELEFKPEDFIRFDNPIKELMDPRDVQLAEAMAEFSAEQANRILREKLGKAPVGEGWGIEQGEWYTPTYKAGFDSESTHKARLVCIEELK